tara:strand:- start:1301 stop:1963 length:663 start_codon:yes stop_codon:yes gene_type:complete
MASDSFKLGIKLESGFDTKFLRSIRKEISSALINGGTRAAEVIETRLQQAVIKRITGSPEYAAITQSEFRGELGLPDAAVRLDAIVRKWAEGIMVKFEIARGSLLGLIKIGILEEGYEDVLSMSEATFRYSSKRGEKNLEWLRWLLLEGGNIIVSDYEYRAENKEGRSRTGLGIMIRRRGGWKIPQQFAGTEENNFATRALEDIQGDIDIIVRQELTKVL